MGDKKIKIIKDIDNFAQRKGAIFIAKDGCNEYVNKGNNGDMSWIVSLDIATVAYYIENGYAIRLSDECEKLEAVKERVENMIKQYTIDHNNMLQSFENGEVQPCVKVEAETVYYNLIKVLNNILEKINE